jgi:hypothetical protein
MSITDPDLARICAKFMASSAETTGDAAQVPVTACSATPGAETTGDAAQVPVTACSATPGAESTSDAAQVPADGNQMLVSRPSATEHR